jgi:hypothetical protein
MRPASERAEWWLRDDAPPPEVPCLPGAVGAAVEVAPRSAVPDADEGGYPACAGSTGLRMLGSGEAAVSVAGVDPGWD